jgi:hypothetical protein
MQDGRPAPELTVGRKIAHFVVDTLIFANLDFQILREILLVNFLQKQQATAIPATARRDRWAWRD